MKQSSYVYIVHFYDFRKWNHRKVDFIFKKMKKKMLFIFAKNISEIEVPKAERLFVHLLAKIEPVFSTLFFTCMLPLPMKTILVLVWKVQFLTKWIFSSVWFYFFQWINLGITILELVTLSRRKFHKVDKGKKCIEFLKRSPNYQMFSQFSFAPPTTKKGGKSDENTKLVSLLEK